MPGRSSGGSNYRYGFNGTEGDEEMYNNKSSHDFGARMYNSDLGRFMSRDKFATYYTGLSPYSFVANTPLKAIDINGDYIKFIGTDEQMAKFDALLNKLRTSAEGERLFQAIVSNKTEVVVSFGIKDYFSKEVNEEKLEYTGSLKITLFEDDGKKNDNGDISYDVSDLARLFREAEKEMYDLNYSESKKNIPKNNSSYDRIVDGTIDAKAEDMLDFDVWDYYFTENIVRDELELTLRNYTNAWNGIRRVYLPLVGQDIKWVGKGYASYNNDGLLESLVNCPTLHPSKDGHDSYKKSRSISPAVNGFKLGTFTDLTGWTGEKTYFDSSKIGSMGEAVGKEGSSNQKSRPSYENNTKD